MVYSGYVAFYGFEFTYGSKLNEITERLLQINPDVSDLIMGARKSQSNSIWYKFPEELISRIFAFVDMSDISEDCDEEIGEYFGNRRLVLTGKRCCYDDDTRFFGFELGSTDFVYRGDVEEYDDFDSYHEHNMKELTDIKEYYDENKDEMDALFTRLKTLAAPLKFPKAKYYTFANDCERCS